MSPILQVDGERARPVQYARREDGTWFKRFQRKSMFGLSWSRWKISGAPLPGYAFAVGQNARLPKFDSI